MDNSSSSFLAQLIGGAPGPDNSSSQPGFFARF